MLFDPPWRNHLLSFGAVLPPSKGIRLSNGPRKTNFYDKINIVQANIARMALAREFNAISLSLLELLDSSLQFLDGSVRFPYFP